MTLFRSPRRLPATASACAAILGAAFVALVPPAFAPRPASAAEPFVEPYDSEKDTAQKRLTPEEAVKGFRTPKGFEVGLFAAEPEVLNPIGMAWDARGRMWVAENFTYAERGKKFDLNLSDRVLIFTDKDGDGKADERKVFIDTVKRLTSVEVGRGGVWLMCPPQLLFVPDANGDDVPDGPPEVVLDGFDVPAENYHNFANGLKWGPDGWLYGRCGASSPGRIRRPDAAESLSVPLNGGLWRYNPKTKGIDVLSHGTTNPWGHDWNEYGEAFYVNTVNGHLWHSIPGAHFRRPHTISPNPLVYEPIEMHADHWHWDTGKDWTDSRKVSGKHDELGGGHAHSGAIVYLADQWPAEYRGRLMTLNFHGRRVNVERLERQGSGYVARHEPDILFSADPWFRGLELSYGPDGCVYILDWSDTGECHDHTGVHRTSGRIFRVSYGKPAAKPAPDLAKMSNLELAALHTNANEWFARTARVELAGRFARDLDLTDARGALQKLLETSPEVPIQLRALFTLHVLGWTDRERLGKLANSESEHVRNVCVKLLSDNWPLDTVDGKVRENNVEIIQGLIFERWLDAATNDSSALVRLALASSLQRIPLERRAPLAARLLAHAEDAADHNIPFVVWYGLGPLARANPEQIPALAANGKFPQVRRWAARYLGEIAAKNPAPLDALLKAATTLDLQAREDVVVGLASGLEGQRKLPAPAAWDAFQKSLSANADLSAASQAKLQSIRVVFGDGRALAEVRKVALDGKADLQQRRAALLTLIEAKPDDLRQVCEQLLKVRFLNTAAIQGLTLYDDPAIGKQLAGSFKAFHPSERSAVVEALVSRPSFAAELLKQVAAGNIARSDLSASQARQIRAFNDAALTKQLSEVWGELKDSPKDKQDLIDSLKAKLTGEVLASADKSNGRAVFAKSCSNCHRLFGSGGEIGPDLTGAGRKNLDYLLSNIIDPSAVVTKDFLTTVFHLTDGRVIQGIAVSETGPTVTVQTAQNRVVLPKDEIDERQASKLSLMPDGLLQPLSPTDVRDLFAYLQGDAQVELPKGFSLAPTPATGGGK